MNGRLRASKQKTDEGLWHDVVPVTLAEFLSLEFPPRDYVLAPFLHSQGSAMVYAYRGIGKTHFSIGCALAVASGTQFLKFLAPKPRPVLFIDGEMPGVALQERFAAAARRLPEAAGIPDPDHLRIITPDVLDGPVPNLATAQGQSAVEIHLGNVELLVLDNVSTLFRGGGRENDEESWVGAQEWILDLRRQGVSTLLIHHAGKGLAQRGTSKREDILDSVINLKRPEDYRMREGARFECHYEKARGIVGDEAAPFEAWLQGENWTLKNVEDAEIAKVLELKANGLSIREIADALSVSKSKVGRIVSENGWRNGRD